MCFSIYITLTFLDDIGRDQKGKTHVAGFSMKTLFLNPMCWKGDDLTLVSGVSSIGPPKCSMY